MAVAVVRVAVVPRHELEGGEAALHVLPGDPQPTVALRSHGVHDVVVAAAEIVDRQIATQRHIAEVAHLLARQDSGVDAGHRLDRLVVRSHSVAHQSVRGGEAVDEVDREVALAPEQRLGCVEAGGPGTHDRDSGPTLIGAVHWLLAVHG